MIDDRMMVIPSITEHESFRRLEERLLRQGGVVGISGLWGSSAPCLCAALQEAVDRPIFYITAHLEEADDVREDLETLSAGQVELFPAWETLPGEGAGGGEIHHERLRLCDRLRTTSHTLLVAPIQALMQPVPTPESLERNTLRLKAGQRHDPSEVIAWLVDRGFARLDRVESPGDFAQRGDIVDVFPPGENDPIRVEFLDDTIEAIRLFDVSTQRSKQNIDSLSVPTIPDRTCLDSEQITTFLSYLSPNTLIALDRPGDVQEMAQTFWSRLNRPEVLFDPGSVLRKLSDFDQIHITRIGAAVGAAGDTFHFDVRSLSRFEGKTERALDELCQAAADHQIVVFCNNDGERARLKELIAERMGDVPASIELRLGLIHRGFEWTATKTLVVGHHELFHRTPTRRLRKTYASRPIESYLDLTPGNLVVHVLHGIAVYRGMKTMQKGRTQKSEEFLTLQFAEKAYLHVSSSQIDLVQKYIGAGGVKPTLSKLGGTRWKKTTERVSEAVSELAESLLRIQALRSQIERNPYPADTPWQGEFEDAFIYEDTEDQILVAGEIKSDLLRPRPMDRLICGDVGYGKTELAMRAAFKVVEYGKQVAVLVPTTVLAEQHYRTFTERLADYPFIIGCLSRFRTAREQRKLVEQAKKGHIDILIGTHRLLSKDVRFADLALVIIDEEQRFGVEHKERLKHLRETVDVLTLSATPIPRTLHMSLIGLRDISSLATPPMDRRSIATQVINFSSDTIRSGIIRELNRDGQVFFVHNRVRSIEAMAERIRKLVPEARVVVGHGQMHEHELEDVMKRFVDKKADVLVCTTIIESGLDMPNVNTIFINDADRFGLANLHQLRGRVGRSAHRGYCYFLLPADRPITAKAAKRLKAVEEFSELGAGFRIAMRDLEIRGAGNVLGAEQSGHIAAVGYEMYCQLLDGSVRRLQGKRPARPTPVHLELDVVAHIPRSYIASERARIDIYRRIVACDTREELEQMDRDLADAFGKYPKPVQRLLDLAEIRILARFWKIRSIVLETPDIVFSVKDSSAVRDVFADVQGTVRSPDRHTIHLRPPPNYLEPDTLLAVLRRMLTARRKKEVVG